MPLPILSALSAEHLYRRLRDGFAAMLFGFAGAFLLAFLFPALSQESAARAALFCLPLLAFFWGSIASPDPSSRIGVPRILLNGGCAGLLAAASFLSVFLALAPGSALSALPALPLGMAAFSFFLAGALLAAASRYASLSLSQGGRVFSIRAILPEGSAPWTSEEALATARDLLPARWGAPAALDSGGSAVRCGPIFLIAEPILPDSGSDALAPFPAGPSAEGDAASSEWIFALLWDPGWRIWLFFDFSRGPSFPRSASRELSVKLLARGLASRADILS